MIALLTTAPSLVVVLVFAAPPASPQPSARPAATRTRDAAAPPPTRDLDSEREASGGPTPQSPNDAGDGPPDPQTPPAAAVTRYQFTGLDIDGELRTPALLQFLARIAGEFETMGIPHRSFMPELRATVMQDAL